MHSPIPPHSRSASLLVVEKQNVNVEELDCIVSSLKSNVSVVL